MRAKLNLALIYMEGTLTPAISFSHNYLPKVFLYRERNSKKSIIHACSTALTVEGKHSQLFSSYCQLCHCSSKLRKQNSSAKTVCYARKIQDAPARTVVRSYVHAIIWIAVSASAQLSWLPSHRSALRPPCGISGVSLPLLLISLVLADGVT